MRESDIKPRSLSKSFEEVSPSKKRRKGKAAFQTSWLDSILVVLGDLALCCAGLAVVCCFSFQTNPDQPTDYSLKALERLRKFDNVSWSLIPPLSMVVYIYAKEIKAGNWGCIMAGLFVAAEDFIGEQLNGLAFYFTNYSALWTTPGESSFIIFIGLNIEIFLMFLMFGIIASKLDPSKPKNEVKTFFGKIPIKRRTAMGIFIGTLGFATEMVLNFIGVMPWTYTLWNAKFPFIMWYSYTRVALRSLEYGSQTGSMSSKIILLKWTIGFVMFFVFAIYLKWI